MIFLHTPCKFSVGYCLTHTLVLFFFIINNIHAEDLNPINYGLKDCKTGTECYYVIYKCHFDALKKGVGVSYEGIDTVRLVIPKDVNSIPLCVRNDFHNCVFIVRNNERKIPLFYLSNKLSDYKEDWQSILKTKTTKEKIDQLIILEDTVPWVQERRGYGYGHTRKDIIFVKNGVLQNNTIADYNISQPRLYNVEINNNITIKNITFIRDNLSNHITFLFKLENQYDITLDNITTITPESNLYEDAIIRMDNCYRVRILNTTINGTYSQISKYGYGICLLNVGDIYIKNLKADGNWGVFGNNNINNIQLIDCDINRFDIHCYGKDIVFRNCTFSKLYNQFSSIFGNVIFKECKFVDFTPVLFESSYNAYTGFNLLIENCIWQVSTTKNYLINVGNSCDAPNPREELSQKCLPNISISNMTITATDNVDDIYLFKVRYECENVPMFDYINIITLTNVIAKSKKNDLNFRLVNNPISFVNQVNIKSFCGEKIIEDIFIDKLHTMKSTNSIIHIK